MTPSIDKTTPQPTTHNPQPDIVLASASPRRQELLKILGIPFSVKAADIDETVHAGESPAEYVGRVARAKAAAVRERDPGAWVIGSDTAVVVNGTILGKPDDSADACRMLEVLSGRWHEVMSAVTLAGNDFTDTLLNITRVRFAELPEVWIEDYVACGEPMDKAGAYAVQGRAATWIPELEGSYTGVMGLPLFETSQLLRKAGLLDSA